MGNIKKECYEEFKRRKKSFTIFSVILLFLLGLQQKPSLWIYLEPIRRQNKGIPNIFPPIISIELMQTLPNQALSLLFPQVSSHFSATKYDFKEAPYHYVNYLGTNANITLRQTIFNADRFIELHQNKQRATASDFKFTDATNNLILILRIQLDLLKEITELGYYPRNRYLDLERGYEDTLSKKAEAEANLLKIESSIKEYELRLKALETDYLRQIETEIAEVDKKLTVLRDQYVAAMNIFEKTEIRAPEDGIVMNLKIRTIGGVITPGQPIMELVPNKADLIIEAKVSPADIESVHPGIKADLRSIAIDPKKRQSLMGGNICGLPTYNTMNS